MTFFALSDADVWDSPGEKAASIDLMRAEADVLHPQRFGPAHRDDTVIPEYSVIPYMPDGTVLYGAYNRFPRKTRWDWTTPDLVF